MTISQYIQDNYRDRTGLNIKMANNGLKDCEVEIISQGLKKFNNLTSLFLDISENEFTSSGSSNLILAVS